jgi:hypothetical protein
MKSIALDGPDGRLRARRWDVVVLGTALPGLVAAVRLGMAGARVLVVAEDAAAKTAPLLLEPFFLAGARAEGVLQQCLTALGVPPIERRGTDRTELAYQVLLPSARVDVGQPGRTQEEWVSWGLAKPELARDAVRGLESAAHAESEALLESTVVRRGVRRTTTPPRAQAAVRPGGRHLRGLPAALSKPEPGLARFLDVQVRALANLASASPSPEARARLLGAPLEGGIQFAPGRGVRALVRRRLEQVHGEVRVATPPFELVEIDGHPGVALWRQRDAWIGRALVLNAPLGRLAGFFERSEMGVPDYLKHPVPPRRRTGVQMRAARELLPEPMCDRLIVVEEEGGEPILVAVHPVDREPRHVDVTVLQAVDDGADLVATHDRLEAVARKLLPFSEKRAVRAAEAPRPVWDDELALADPAGGGGGWPTEVEIRLGTRAPVFSLAREELGGLGAEGDLVLGWQAGDTIAAALPKPALG